MDAETLIYAIEAIGQSADSPEHARAAVEELKAQIAADDGEDVEEHADQSVSILTARPHRSPFLRHQEDDE